MTSTATSGADADSSSPPEGEKPPSKTASSELPPPHDDSLNTSAHRSPNFSRGTLRASLEGKLPAGLLNKADTPTGGLTPAVLPGTPIGSATPNQVPSSPTPKSRQPSFSGSKPKDLPTKEKPKKVTQPSPNPNNFASNAYLEHAEKEKARAPSRASSVKSLKSDDGEGKHSFRLKDLLANGPKLNRRSSNKSTKSLGSGKSDSDINEVDKYHGGKSEAGQSVGSLSSKYGVCQKVAIGRGATSVVRLAHKWDRTQEKLYAVKEFRKRRKNETEKEYVKKLTAEFCISSTLHHPNVVETVDLVQDENQKWCEVMEFCPGGDLYAAIKKGGMSPAEVECCFKQILLGVNYLHAQGVAHRDIKPENLFFDVKGHLKIGDYGASTVYRLPWESTVHMSTGLCGSEPYIAPEQFLGKPYDARLVDIWAVGIVYYCLHFQELPWRAAQQTDEMYKDYATACLQYPLPKSREDAEAQMKEKQHGSHGNAVPGCPPTINNLSPRACRPLIRHMLEPDPKKRATIEDVMQYTWFKNIQVCFEQATPGHIHVNAQSMSQMVVKEVYE